MNVSQAYQQQRGGQVPRVDVVLSLYDAALERLQRILTGIEPSPERTRLLSEVQLIAAGIGVGIDPAAGEIPANLQRLCEFVGHCVIDGSEPQLRSALDILRTMRDAFSQVRGQAVQLERTFQIPPMDHTGLLRVMA